MRKRTLIVGGSAAAIVAGAVAASVAIGERDPVKTQIQEMRDNPPVEVIIEREVEAGKPNKVTVLQEGAQLDGAKVEVDLKLNEAAAPTEVGQASLDTRPAAGGGGQVEAATEVDFTVPQNAGQQTELAVTVNGRELSPIPLIPEAKRPKPKAPEQDPVLVVLERPATPGGANVVTVSGGKNTTGDAVQVKVRPREGTVAQGLGTGTLRQIRGSGASASAGGPPIETETEVPVTLPGDLGDGAELVVTVDGKQLRPMPLATGVTRRAGPPRGRDLPVVIELTSDPEPGQPNTVVVRADGKAIGGNVDIKIRPQPGASAEQLGTDTLTRDATPAGQLDAAEGEVPVTIPANVKGGAELIVTVDGKTLPPMPLEVE